MFIVNKNTRVCCEICSVLTIKTPERRLWPRSGVFTVNFEHIIQLVLVLKMTIGLLQARIIVGGSHHTKTPTRRQHDLKLL